MPVRHHHESLHSCGNVVRQTQAARPADAQLEAKRVAATSMQLSMESLPASGNGAGALVEAAAQSPAGGRFSSQAFKEELASRVAYCAAKHLECVICHKRVALKKDGYVPPVDKESVITQPCIPNAPIHAICWDCMVQAIKGGYLGATVSCPLCRTEYQGINYKNLQNLMPHLATVNQLYTQYRRQAVAHQEVDAPLLPGNTDIIPQGQMRSILQEDARARRDLGCLAARVSIGMALCFFLVLACHHI